LKKFNLKKFLKSVKLNEESISMVLGAVVIVIVGILVVNYFRDKKGQTTSESLATANQETQFGKVHKVTKGESLWSISEDVYGSGYNWSDIYKNNNLKSTNIEVGQELVLPDVSSKEPTATKQVLTVEQEHQTVSENNTYTVVHGDNLWKVAVKTYGDGYKWVEIAKANNLTNPNVIHAGNVLTLPR
jgi:nucleoid-associated protein YgaU